MTEDVTDWEFVSLNSYASYTCVYMIIYIYTHVRLYIIIYIYVRLYIIYSVSFLSCSCRGTLFYNFWLENFCSLCALHDCQKIYALNLFTFSVLSSYWVPLNWTQNIQNQTLDSELRQTETVGREWGVVMPWTSDMGTLTPRHKLGNLNPYDP